MAAQLLNALWGRPAAAAQRPLEPAVFVGNATASKVAMKSRTCLVEVIPTESEPEEVTLRRFSAAVRRTGMYFEVKRRQRFECKQDRIKRKRKERPLKKRIRYIPTYAKSGPDALSVPPFADLFDNPDDDIFAQAGVFKPRYGQDRSGRDEYRPRIDSRVYQPNANKDADDGDVLGLDSTNDDSNRVELAGLVESKSSE